MTAWAVDLIEVNTNFVVYGSYLDAFAASQLLKSHDDVARWTDHLAITNEGNRLRNIRFINLIVLETVVRRQNAQNTIGADTLTTETGSYVGVNDILCSIP
jgi:hypothetical protein